jgi:hypothetical protein
MILNDLQFRKQNHGGVVHQLVKLLCRENRLPEALRLANKAYGTLHPERYNTPVRVEILLAQQRWEEALAELRDITDTDEHLVGLKKKTYLQWARAVEGALQRDIAAMGLGVKISDSLMENMPILVTSARLAFLAGDDAAAENVVARVHELNPVVADLLKAQELDAGYWEDSFD